MYDSSMGIFDRFNKVLQSNLNSVLDKAEDPDKLIGQTILDMESEVKKARQELVTAVGTGKRLDKKKEELVAESQSWEDKAVLALKNNDEPLAREALKRKAKTARDIEDTARQAAESYTSAEQMKSTLERVERRIEELKNRRGSLAAQVRQSRSADAATTAGKSSSFAELERMSSRIDQMDAEVEAQAALDDPNRAAVDAKFRELEKSSSGGVVEDELQALKKRLEGK